MNINKLLEDEDPETVIMAGDTHEDNKTVIDDVFIREEMELMDKEYLSKHYDVLDLDEVGIMGDKKLQGGQYRFGMDLTKYNSSTVGKNSNGEKDNRHMSYINDVMEIDNKPDAKTRQRQKSPDSLDSFHFLSDQKEVSGVQESDDAHTATAPKHLRTEREPISALKGKPPSNKKDYFDGDSF